MLQELSCSMMFRSLLPYLTRRVAPKALRGWGTPEDCALRDMSFSAGVMVRRGTPDQNVLGSVPKYQHCHMQFLVPFSAKWVSVFDKVGTCS